ncbi:MAG: fibrobacter succinogenes major paralogous domain-containing protein [Fibrobacter sp.]|nr:fibrobacter succinogenes major paralogous domain-containing protein [Fibrobacter sp.]
MKSVSSSSSKKNEVSSSSEISKISSSGKASWAYLNPAISYGETTDNRDGQVYKTVKIGEQTWMAENLNYKVENSYCYKDSTKYCDKYGRLYTWQTAKTMCPDDWHLPTMEEFLTLITVVGGYNKSGTYTKSGMLKSLSGWRNSGNGSDNYGFSALPAGQGKSFINESIYAYFWSSTEYNNGDKNKAYSMALDYNSDIIGLVTADKLSAFLSIRCIKNEIPKSSSSVSSSSSSKASWAYLNPAISYGEMTDERDGQVYKTVIIDKKTWMAENLNYESIKSYCYENKKDSCSKYGRLYIWSAAMDSVGAFTTNSKGCGYPNECHNTKNPVRGVCPEKWHLPSQQEWYDISTYNSSTINGDLSSAGERLKSTNGWFNSGNGDNTYGFSILPAGVGSEENFSRSGEKTCFWSSSDKNGVDAYGIHFEYSNSKGVLQGSMKSSSCSVRCVKD